MHLLKSAPKSDFQKNLFGKSKTLTNRNIYSFHKEIISWKQNASVIEYFWEEKINDFYHKNSEKLNVVILQMKALDKKYFQMDENGKIIYVKNEPPLQQKTRTTLMRTPEMNEGLTLEEYSNEFESLMNEPCNFRY